MKKIIQTVIIAIIVGAISGGLTTFLINSAQSHDISEKSNEELALEFYTVENAVHVSPHHIRKAMAKGDDSFVLVDLRSQEEYEEEHVVGAVSIPAYKDRDHSDYGSVKRIVGSFMNLKQENPYKEIIVYCYSIPCMTGRKIGKMLSDNGIYVKHLGVGWNEWRYFWTLWNHPHEWNNTNVLDYVTSGPEPGIIKEGLSGNVCAIEGTFGC
ncbi:MAG: rhodanese-like domain-containing protein [Candidatus Woesearchaeota archaeon]|jgi:rhodanese-related sulfurtransferase|nr:rhodanese-like domain-containing protein [Candidatus Woesearchaeota archaeon]